LERLGPRVTCLILSQKQFVVACGCRLAAEVALTAFPIFGGKFYKRFIKVIGAVVGRRTQSQAQTQFVDM